MERNQLVKIMAIETSCDETAAALVQVTNGYKKVTGKLRKVTSDHLTQPQVTILCNVVSSQIKLHAKYGGVYPELASREHIRNILPVINEAIEQCGNLTISEIDYFAVTTGPGLIGSLLPGVNTAETLSYIFNKPIYAINHIEGHIYSNFIGEFSISNFQFPNLSRRAKADKSQRQMSKQFNPSTTLGTGNSTIQQFDDKPQFPLLALVVSGGHTSLILMNGHLKYKIIGETLDDAAGEAFDKVAAMLGLGYPGGPIIAAEAARIKNLKLKIKNFGIRFPRPMIDSGNFDFSFSGLKTSVLYTIKKLPKPLSLTAKQLICKEFQDAVVDTLIAKTILAAKKYKVKSILLCGGVAANFQLRENLKLKVKSKKLKVNVFMPDKKLCTDNAAMIGIAASYKTALGKKATPWYNVNADANQKLK